ncbi:uncharacterized protein VTP21DRAFT_11710 [Calcarisporiella thermophila]|uniref:uncharacterized protein n=1 Tax=Calcarisporiella thermophila TaxID=911321 RepID=UPI0037440E2C
MKPKVLLCLLVAIITLASNSSVYPVDAADGDGIANFQAAVDEIPITTDYYNLNENEYGALRQLVKLAFIANCRNITAPFACPAECSDFSGMQLEKKWLTEKFDSRGFIGRDSKEKIIVVSWGGTNTLRNLIQDIKAFPVDYPHSKGAKVHYGFFETYNDARDIVMNTITTLIQEHPDHSVLVLGHSLGGALATYNVIDLRKQFPNLNLRLNTFGEPRAGDQNFVKFYESLGIKTKRIVENTDPVPQATKTKDGWRHFGVEIWHNGQKTVQCLQDEDPKCSNSVTKFDLEDHVNYLGVKMICDMFHS